MSSSLFTERGILDLVHELQEKQLKLDEANNAYPTVAEIAEEMGRSEPTARRIMKQLVKAGKFEMVEVTRLTFNANPRLYRTTGYKPVEE